MSWPCRIAFAVAFAATAASPSSAAPNYIEASPDALTAAYGADVAKRAFSDELTETRAALIKGSVEIVPGLKCPAAPAFEMTAAFPFQVEPTDVIWVERYNVACKKPLHRSLLVFLKDGEITAVPITPGATLADPRLQVDARTFAASAAVTQASKECDEAMVVDTEVTKQPPQGGGPWKERWYVNACGEVKAVDVRFTPSAGGGTDISAIPAID
jgi:hypothetical protein